ncbi:MAG TPA: 3-dehydroquinate synthase [Planctomycetota bacterium]
MDRRFQFRRSAISRIVLGSGVEAQLAKLIGELDADHVMLVHDPVLPALAARIARAVGARASLAVPGGESCKRLEVIGRLAHDLSDAGATRSTAIVGLGGGTITDLVGFLAATYMRGVPLVLCPTTMLAMCDAAVGGKNGVDMGGLKNMLGTIRQPDLVVADIEWLQTLPDELFREGLVEVVKKAAVLDAARFNRLEQIAKDVAARNPEAVAEVVEMAVMMKMEVVLADEKEAGRRRWLNFGHTIGHAIESLAAGTIRHGSAVAMGLAAECRAAGPVVPAGVTARIEALLHALGVATVMPHPIADAARLWQLAQKDKKVRRGSVPMVVPTTIGKGVVVELSAQNLARSLA